MTFTSLAFFGFVLAALVCYYICPKRFRWIVLLTASFAFYSIVCFKYLPFIIFTILSTWAGGLWLEKEGKKRKAILKANKADWTSDEKKQFKHRTMVRRRLITALVLVLNFGILAVLKYYNFFAEWIGGIFNISLPFVTLLLPLGISFYTFQTMGYILDVYWEKTEPEKNIFKFALFASFFPQIVQGPIAIYNDLACQLYEGHDLRYENIKYGFQLILWGMFKKVIIADRMAVAINAILPVKNEMSNFYSLFVLLMYAGQLYLDFSGGIDIARGVAEMFGINMAENFRRPYFSKSVSEFWRRWHISLGHWLRTYLFYPIAVSKAFLRFGKWIGSLGPKHDDDIDLPADSLWGGFTFFQHLGRVLPGCIATIITFLVIGMWHGANWRYAGYGLWNGIVIFFAMLFDPVFKWLLAKLKVRTKTFSWRLWQIARTFVLIMVGFVFDLGYNMSDSIQMVVRCFDPAPGSGNIMEKLLSFGLTEADYIIIIAGLITVFCVSLYQERSKVMVRTALDKQSVWFQWAVMIAGLLCIIIFGQYGPGIAANEFVYMQF